MKFSPDHQSHSAFASLVAAIMGGSVTGWRLLWPPIVTGLLTYLGTRLGSALWSRLKRRMPVLERVGDSTRPSPLPPPPNDEDTTDPATPNSKKWKRLG